MVENRKNEEIPIVTYFYIFPMKYALKYSLLELVHSQQLKSQHFLHFYNY